MGVTPDEVERDLGSLFPRLYAIAKEAVGTYRSEGYSPRIRKDHSKRSRASLIHDHWVAAASRLQEEFPDLRLELIQHLWVLCVGSRYAIRFKMVDDDKLPAAGHLTGQTIRFRNQLPLDGLEEPPGHNLEIGYQLDSLGQLHRVFLISPSGNQSNEWEYELSDNGAAAVVVSLFPRPAADPGAAQIVPKKPEKFHETEPGDGNSGA